MAMFGPIGTFNAAGSSFQNAGGDQFNSDFPPPPGMVGPADPQFQSLLSARANSSPGPRRSPAAQMFETIEYFNADGSDFSNAGGNQYNYNLGRATASAPAITHVPAHQNIPPPNRPSTPLPEVTVAEAEARMFGSIKHFQAPGSNFSNSGGDQINIRAHRTSDIPTSAPNLSVPPLQSNTAPTNSHLSTPNIPASAPNLSVPPLQSNTAPASPHLPPLSKASKNKLTAAFSKKASRHPEGYGVADTALGISELVLTTLRGAAKFSPVPYLSDAADVSLTLLQGIQGSKDNKEAFGRLAEHACELISSVVVVQQEGEAAGRPMAPKLEYNLGVLVSKLRPIEEYVSSQTERNGVTRFVKHIVMHKVDAGKIKEYQERLTQALAEFSLRSNINVQDGVAQINQRMEDLVDMMRQFALQHPPTSGPAMSGPTIRSYGHRG